jgi:tetratricopeptide (TPR) repeat protein
MSSSDDTRPPEEAEPETKTASASADSSEPVWPPVEARPAEPSGAATDEPGKSEASAAPATAGEDPILTKPSEAPEPPAAAAWEEKASEPKQEMGLSESTLHWLVDGEQALEPRENDPGTGPVYDSRAPVAGRKHNVAVIGGAAIVAFAVAMLLHGQAARHQTAADVPTAEPARVLTKRAETALAAGRSGEAMDLAHLAIVTDPDSADAYVVVGKIQRDSGRAAEARDSFRKYLELAPIGTHAQEARDALTALPP